MTKINIDITNYKHLTSNDVPRRTLNAFNMSMKYAQKCQKSLCYSYLMTLTFYLHALKTKQKVQLF